MQPKKRIQILPLIVLLLILSQSAAYAIDMEYYTYNGFAAIVSAFTKIALIFSDADYKGLFFTVIVLGILIGGMMVYFLALTGSRITPLSWAWSVGIGVTIYLALILPKGTLNIYDPVKNQYQAVGGIPDGLVAIIGLLNKIERGLVDIVATAADPVGYQQQAGGIGFDMLLNIQSKGILLSDQYIHLSLKKYVEDCIYFELARPGTTLTINSLANNADFIPLFRTAASPAIYTTFYRDSKPEGSTLTCADAETAIEAAITNPAIFEGASRARCADAGFDPSIPAEYSQCKAMLGSLVSWFEGALFDTTQLYRQDVMAQALSSAAQSASPDTAIALLAGRDTGTSMLSTGMVANEWIPIIRAVTTAVAVGLLPFLVVFIPTPLFGRAVMLIAGFFIWLTAWGVTDAIAHQFAMDYAAKAFAEVKQYQLGLTAISGFGTASLKTLAAFGAIRWSGLMLATVITSMLVRFGGHALGMLAGEITGSAQHGAQTAGRVATPEGGAGLIGALENAPPVMANAYKFDFSERTHARANMISRSTGEGLELLDADTAFEVGAIQGASSRGFAFGKKHFAADVAGGNVAAAATSAQYFELSTRYGRSKGQFDQAHQIFGIQTPTEAAAFNSTGRAITPEMAESASRQGYKGVISGMRLTDIGFDPNSGRAAAMSFAGPVTEENIGALKEISSNSGHKGAAAMLKPGMIASYSIDPESGKGTFSATDTTSVKSEDFAEKTFQAGKGLAVDTPFGSFQLKSGKVQEVGGQLYINGTTNDNKDIALRGSLMDGYSVIPGLKRGADGTAHYSTEPDAALYEFQKIPTDQGRGGDLRTSVVKDSSGDITAVSLNLTSGKIDGGVQGYETLNGKELKSLAGTLRSQGNSNQAVNTLEYLADRGMSANVQYSYPAHGGEMGQLSVSNEKSGKMLDFSMSQSGWEEITKAHSSSLSGKRSVAEDVDRSTVDHGVGFGSMMQMALNRDPAIARFVSDFALAKYKPEAFEASVAETAKDLASDVGGFLKKEGGRFESLGGSLGINTPIARGNLGMEFRESESINLLTEKYDNLIRQSVTEAKGRGLSRGESEKYIAERVGDFTQQIYDQARTTSSSTKGFGADTPIDSSIK